MPTEHKVSLIREMTSDEIRGKIRDLNEEMFNLRFRNSMKQLDNPLQIREAKRALARYKTVLRERGDDEYLVEKVAHGKNGSES
jgi:large subunit ribosomal protein L29